jgi:hypothetical protein
MTMKLSWRLFLGIGAAAVLALSGCALGGKVAGNQFTYDSPRMDIAVSPDFKYIGKEEGAGGTEDILGGPTSVGSTKKETYTWVSDPPGRAVTITVSKLLSPQWSFHTPAFDKNARNVLEHEVATLGGMDYERALRIVDIKNKTACVLAETMSAIANSTVNVMISYSESLAKSGYSCQQWYAKGNLNDGQRRYLNEFLMRANAAYSPKPAFLNR